MFFRIKFLKVREFSKMLYQSRAHRFWKCFVLLCRHGVSRWCADVHKQYPGVSRSRSRSTWHMMRQFSIYLLSSSHNLLWIRYHKVGNPSESQPAITLHLYCPPIRKCKIWLDPSHASRPSTACMCNHSEYGQLKSTQVLFEVHVIWWFYDIVFH